MIISHKHRFIFIKTAKTAGTSIELFLARHCGSDDVVTPIFPPVEGHAPRNFTGLFNPIPEIVLGRFRDTATTLRQLAQRRKFFNHMPGYKVRARIPRTVWGGYFKFCVERNPWDKTVSHYHMLNHRQGGALTFDDYLAAGQFCINHPLYCERFGRTLIVDRVLRYENLTQETLAEVLGMLGIPFDGTLHESAKSGYRPDRKPCQECFTDRQREIVAAAFETEIALHGYRFE